MADSKTLATVWREFSQSTGFHGVNKLKNGSKLRCLFWLCSFLACAVYLTYVMIQELGNYYTYPTYTTLEVETHSEIEFPAVTICNLNSLSKSSVLNDSRVDNYYLSIGPREIHQVQMYNKFNWSDPFYEQNGFFSERKMEDILLEHKRLHQGLFNIFVFDQTALNDSKEYFSVELKPNGPCLTSNKTKILKTSNTGSEYNFVMWLNLEQEDSYFGQRLGEGVQFTVHDKDEDPYFHGSSGYYVEPGHEYYGALRKYTVSYSVNTYYVKHRCVVYWS